MIYLDNASTTFPYDNVLQILSDKQYYFNASNLYNEAEKSKILIEDVRKNNGKVLLALEDEKVVGIIVGTIKEYSDWDHLDYKCPKTGNISELVVTKNSRAKGTGKKLIAEMEKYFKDCGCEYVYLDVFAYNENAIKFYNKNNYHARMHGLIKKID